MERRHVRLPQVEADASHRIILKSIGYNNIVEYVQDPALRMTLSAQRHVM